MTNAELNQLSILELRELNRKVVEMIKLKMQFEGKIKAAGGINGLCKFFNEINTKDSPFNPCCTNLFIEL